MSKKTVGVVLLVAGVLLFLVSAAADSLGIGGAPGFGWKQTLGMIIGVVLAATGITNLRSAKT